MENVALHVVKSNTCPKCEVPLEKLGTNTRNQYLARVYARYEGHERETGFQSPGSGSDTAGVTSDTVRINMRHGAFHGLHRVSAPDLHMPDLLHTIYLELFKHMMDWTQSFLKKHAQLQAFDAAWKTLPRYPGLFIPKKA